MQENALQAVPRFLLSLEVQMLLARAILDNLSGFQARFLPQLEVAAEWPAQHLCEREPCTRGKRWFSRVLPRA